jgi:hypothetical protein
MQSKPIMAALLAGAMLAGTLVASTLSHAQQSKPAQQAKQKVILLSVSGMH